MPRDAETGFPMNTLKVTAVYLLYNYSVYTCAISTNLVLREGTH